jgi:hypothetical protein
MRLFIGGRNDTDGVVPHAVMKRLEVVGDRGDGHLVEVEDRMVL